MFFFFLKLTSILYLRQPWPFRGPNSTAVPSTAAATATTAVSEHHSSPANSISNSGSYPSVTGTLFIILCCSAAYVKVDKKYFC
jgi:hypothetical protein